MSQNPIDFYDERRMFGQIADRLQSIFLERVNGSEFDLGHLDPEDFDHEPWHRYVESIGARMMGEGKIERDTPWTCRWDGERALPTGKDDYDHLIVLNPNIGDPYILVPKELAMKILLVGSLPR
jgi:hypothetical protein